MYRNIHRHDNKNDVHKFKLIINRKSLVTSCHGILNGYHKVERKLRPLNEVYIGQMVQTCE